MMEMENLRFTFDPTEEASGILETELKKFSELASHNPYMTHEIKDEDVGIYVYEGGSQPQDHGDFTGLVGGLSAKLRHNHSWMYIALLWIKEEYRRAGLGSRLMEEAERYAKSMGAQTLSTETWDFQAKGFYEKMGFEVIGAMPDCPPGTVLYLLIKRI